MKLRTRARILFRTARIYLMGTYREGRHCTVLNWRDARAVAMIEDLKQQHFSENCSEKP